MITTTDIITGPAYKPDAVPFPDALPDSWKFQSAYKFGTIRPKAPRPTCTTTSARRRRPSFTARILAALSL